MAIPTATTFELIESHGNILRHSMVDFAGETAKCVTENAEVMCPHAVGPRKIVPKSLGSRCTAQLIWTRSVWEFDLLPMWS